MKEKEEKISKLAKSLHHGGFAPSETSALEKAKEMVEIEDKITESQEKKGFFKGLKEKLIRKKEEEAPVKLDNYDITTDDRTVSEIMEEAGVGEAELNKKEELKEEAEELKKEIEEEKKELRSGRIEEIKKKEKEIKEDIETLEEEEGERIDIE